MSDQDSNSDLFTLRHHSEKRVVVPGAGPKPLWLDVVAPTREDFEDLSKFYSFHPALVEDSLEPEHLPKFERHGEHSFVILRSFDDSSSAEADSVQELTNKIAIFIGPDFIVTIHRKDQELLERLRRKWSLRHASHRDVSIHHVLSDLFDLAISSFDEPLKRLIDRFEAIEASVLASGSEGFDIKEGYYLRRKASVIGRVTRLSSVILNKLHDLEEHDPQFYQDIKDTAAHIYFYSVEIVENVDKLLEHNLSILSQRTNSASHRTNEIIRVLTIFSIFFLPLNFIAGIYGMNFAHMPELKLKYAYPVVLILMLLVAGGIYYWVKRSGWLKS